MNTGDTKYLLSLVGFALFAVLWPYCSIFFNETGCVIFAKLAGMHPYKVRVGKGKRVFILKLRGIEFELCGSMSSGLTLATYRTLDNLKFQHFFFVLGGMAADFIVILTIITTWKFFDNKIIPIYAMFVQVCLFISTLFEDGKQLISILFSKEYINIKNTYRDIYKELTRYEKENNLLSDSFLNNDLSLFMVFINGVKALSENDFEKVINYYEMLIKYYQIPPTEKAYLLDMLCGIVINKGDMN